MMSQTLARAIVFAVCLTVFLFKLRPLTFAIGLDGKKSIRSELIIFGVRFSFETNAKDGFLIFMHVFLLCCTKLSKDKIVLYKLMDVCSKPRVSLNFIS